MAKYTRGDLTTVVFGRKFYKDGSPVIGALVTLHNITSNTQVTKATTDKYGRYNIIVPNASITMGSTYEIRYYGTGLVQKAAPDGDWERFTTVSNPVSDSVGIFYRGEYSPTKIYNFNTTLRDAVRVTGAPPLYEKKYYLCSIDGTTGTFVEANWTRFTNEFDSVATDILLAQDATIARKLIVGSDDGGGHYGIIASPLVSGLYEGDGFYIANENTGTGLFRIGNVDGANLIKGLLWDGPNNTIQFKASNFEVTASGYMWANRGGFGGTSSSVPALTLGNEGLVAYRSSIPVTYVTGNDTWRVEPSAWVSEAQVVQNGSFTVSGIGSLAYWTASTTSGSAAVAVVSGISSEGSHSVELTAGGLGDEGNAQVVQSFNVVQNQVYTFSFDWTSLMIVNAGGRVRYSLACNGVIDSRDLSLKSTDASYTWNSYSKTFKANDSVATVTFYNDLADQQTYDGTKVYVDNVECNAYSAFSELNLKGLLIANSPTSYIRFGDSLAEIKTDELTVNDLNIYGNLNLYGSTFTAADNLLGTSSPSFTVGTSTSGGTTTLQWGIYGTTTKITSDGLYLTSGVNFKAPRFLANNVSVATSNDLDLEVMRMNFQYVSWAQFAIFDNFADSTKRDAGDTGSPGSYDAWATVSLNELTKGTSGISATSVFHSKTYTNITTLFSGTDGVGGTASMVVTSGKWFTNELKNLTLTDSTPSNFTVTSNDSATPATITVTGGNPVTGAYALKTANAAYLVPFCTYKDCTNGTGDKYKGYVVLEFSANGGTNYTKLLDTRPAYNINLLETTVSFSTYSITAGTSYKVRITLANDTSGNGPTVQNFLIATDPSVWRF